MSSIAELLKALTIAPNDCKQFRLLPPRQSDSRLALRRAYFSLNPPGPQDLKWWLRQDRRDQTRRRALRNGIVTDVAI